MEENKCTALKQGLTNLLKIKSILTLTLTFVFAYLAIIGSIEADKFLDIFAIVVVFYFGVQTAKGKE